MIRRGLIFLFLCLLVPLPAQAEVTQRQWLVQLVDSLGWSYGLPDEPSDEDYSGLLSGRRDFRFEIEDISRQQAPLAVKRLTNFGAYSGAGWVSGERRPVQIELLFLLPHPGSYRLAASSFGSGVQLRVGEERFALDPREAFARQDLGSLTLPAGPTEVLLELPPDGGADYLELRAPSLPTVGPLQGWGFEQPLTAEVMSLTTLQGLDLLSLLRPAAPPRLIETETSQLSALPVVRDRYLGAPSGGAWVRTGNRPATLQLPLRITQPGCYRLELRGSSEQPVRVAVDELFSTQLSFGAGFTEVTAGHLCLQPGAYRVHAELSSWAGIDFLKFTRLDTRPSSLNTLVGIPPGVRLVDEELATRVLGLVSGLSR